MAVVGHGATDNYIAKHVEESGYIINSEGISCLETERKIIPKKNIGNLPHFI